jgi:hypothetical protein
MFQFKLKLKKVVNVIKRLKCVKIYFCIILVITNFIILLNRHLKLVHRYILIIAARESSVPLGVLLLAVLVTYLLNFVQCVPLIFCEHFLRCAACNIFLSTSSGSARIYTPCGGVCTCSSKPSQQKYHNCIVKLEEQNLLA